MGNKIARTTQVSASEYYLHDLPSSYNLVLKEVLGRGRFFKSIQCKHDEGLVLVKVYFKRGDFIDLKEYERRLSEIRGILRSIEHSHVWPFQYWLETDKAAYLLRQYFFSNLHDRLSTRPFLSVIEKKWIAFQLLYAVKQCHENGVCHGDIKCENVLVTSWNWVYLADFASFKPTYVPDDDPSDFSFFFDTGGRRRCYLAPERFFEHGAEIQSSQDAPLKPSMDIFSLGCVIAELFLEGQPLFELSQLLAYRRGQYDPGPYLEKIPETGIRRMILHMIQLDPELRLTAESYLQNYSSVVFLSYFSPLLHDFFSCLVPLDSDTRVAMAQSAFPEIHKQMTNNSSCGENIPAYVSSPVSTISEESFSEMRSGDSNSAMPKDNCMKNGELEKRKVGDSHSQLVNTISVLLKDVEHNTRQPHSKVTLDKVHSSASCNSNEKNNSFILQNALKDNLQSSSELFQTIEKGFKKITSINLKKIAKNDLATLLAGCNNESNTSSIAPLGSPQHTLKCEGMVLIASLLCSCIRSVKLPQLRRTAILLLKYTSLYIDDEDRLQHVLPYIIAMLSDTAAIVRCAALQSLCDILPLVHEFPPSDAKIFPEYILPMLSMLPDDPEESVRISYASNISKIALTAFRFLVHSERLNVAVVLDLQNKKSSTCNSISEPFEQIQDSSNDAQLVQLRKSIGEVLQELVMGPKQTPNIRRALLHDIGNLCCFFGKRQSNDFLLPILPAFLNDRDDQLRAVFYEQIVFVCFFVGRRSVEEYLLPYIEQALSDNFEAVIVNGLECLTLLCRHKFLRKKVLLDMIERASPLLCYPSEWVRRSAVGFISASSVCLEEVDSYVYLSPILLPFLRNQPASLASEKSLYTCLKSPVTRQVFYEVLESTRTSDMLERQRKIWYNSASFTRDSDSDILSKRPEGFEGARSPTRGWLSQPLELQRSKSIHTAVLRARPEVEAGARLRPVETVMSSMSGSLDVREASTTDKLQFSGLSLPHVSTGNSFICDGPTEGIPLYSFCADKHPPDGAVASGSEISSQWGSLGIGLSSTMPWMDSMNRSFTLSSSLAPKLVSGSYGSSASKQVFKVIPDAGHEKDEIVNLSGRLKDTNISGTLKYNQPAVGIGDVSPIADLAGTPYFARASSVTDAGWRPRGVLMAHLQEHHSAVNDIAISNDHSFFISASDDSCVKVWDTRKLEKDISFRSRVTYSLDGSRALCATMLHGGPQVAVGASDGTIHVFAVDQVSKGSGSIERYLGISDIKRQETDEGAVLNLSNYSTDGSPSLLVLYSTRGCGIHLWDVRANTDSWTLKSTPEEGYVSSLVTDTCGNWFVSGSSRGVLTLWDVRFLLPVNSWQYPAVCPIEKMCLLIPPLTAPLSATSRPLVYVAAGCNEVSLWNAENGSCHQVFRLANNGVSGDNSEIPWALARPSSKSNLKLDSRQNFNKKYRVEELNEPPARWPGIRSLLPLVGGDLLTGGTDLKIRLWDHCSPDRSYCVCGPSTNSTAKDEYYDTRSCFDVQVVQETNKLNVAPKLVTKTLLAAAATDSAGCHRDAVLSLASVKLNQRLLISSSRDGAVKVWK
ncbi:putative serine/threonine-protein kinase [Nymphaea thermarum]|nr:putative serine/threonine-protein kinase [Nymphaea thermarum]